jgi:hypothetical protein
MFFHCFVLFSPVLFFKKYAVTRPTNYHHSILLLSVPARKTGPGGLKGLQFQKWENRSFTALQNLQGDKLRRFMPCKNVKPCMK